MVGLSPAWSGVIADTASTSTLVALICAREKASGHGQARGGLQAEGAPLVVYTSDQAHSSVGAALASAQALAADGAPSAAAAVHALTTSGFFSGFQAACLVAAGVSLTGVAISARAVPAQPPAEASLGKESVGPALTAA